MRACRHRPVSWLTARPPHTASVQWPFADPRTARSREGARACAAIAASPRRPPMPARARVSAAPRPRCHGAVGEADDGDGPAHAVRGSCTIALGQCIRTSARTHTPTHMCACVRVPLNGAVAPCRGRRRCCTRAVHRPQRRRAAASTGPPAGRPRARPPCRTPCWTLPCRWSAMHCPSCSS